MGVLPEEMKSDSKSPYIKASEFEKGMALEVVGFKVIKSKNPKYGANEKDWLMKEGKLKEGETCEYSFKTLEDGEDPLEFPSEEKVLESKSAAFFIAFSNLDPDEGEKIWVMREGQGENTRYTIDYYRNQDKKKK